MSRIIRVQTLTLPIQDNIASFILSNPHYEILVNERNMTKTGDVIMHLQYVDHSDPALDEILLEDIQEKLNGEGKTVEGALAAFGLLPEDSEEEGYVPIELQKNQSSDKKVSPRKKKSKGGTKA